MTLASSASVSSCSSSEKPLALLLSGLLGRLKAPQLRVTDLLGSVPQVRVDFQEFILLVFDGPPTARHNPDKPRVKDDKPAADGHVRRPPQIRQVRIQVLDRYAHGWTLARPHSWSLRPV